MKIADLGAKNLCIGTFYEKKSEKIVFFAKKVGLTLDKLEKTVYIEYE